MKQYLIFRNLLLLLLIGATLKAQAQQTTAPKALRAGTIVSPETIRQTGEGAFFTADTLTDAVFKRMWLKSFKRHCTVSRRSLRYLRVLHSDAEGRLHVGEMVCNKRIADDLLDIFHQLYKARYPIERMVLIDNYDADDERSMADNNSSCFNFRQMTTGKALSKHAQGLAVDLNTLYNPYVKRLKNGTLMVSPAAGRPYANRKTGSKYQIKAGDLCHRLFLEHGFKWGGAWRHSKDYQHFEK